MSDSVYKSIEITGSSPESVDQAIRNAIAKASETIRNIDWFEVTQIRGVVEGDDSGVGYFQVTVKLGFRLE